MLWATLLARLLETKGMKPNRKRVWTTQGESNAESVLDEVPQDSKNPKEQESLHKSKNPEEKQSVKQSVKQSLYKAPLVPNECVPEGTLWTLHIRREHIFLFVAFGLCLVLWTRLCSVSAKLALLESSAHLYHK